MNPTSCPIRIQISGDVSGAVANTIKLTFTPISGIGATTTTLTYSGSSQDISMNINSSNLLGSFAAGGTTVTSVSPGTVNTLTNAIYSVRASYQRVNGGSIVTSTQLVMRFWIKTPPPKITTTTGSFISKFLNFGVNIPGYVPDSLPTLLAGSKNILIKDTLNNNTYTLNLTDASSSFVINTSKLSAVNEIGSTTFSPSSLTDSLPDGGYKLFFSYQDGRPHSAATDSISFNIKSFTATPIINFPSPGAVFNSSTPFKVNYYLTDLSSTASIKVASSTLSNVYALSTTNSGNLDWSPSTKLPDGKYGIKLTYYDLLANPPASASVDSIIIKTESASPQIQSPIDGAIVNTIFYKDTVSEAASISDTLTISGFSNDGVYQIRKLALRASNLSNTFTYNVKNNPTDSVHVISFTGAAILPDGNYTLTRKHQDIYSNPYVNSNTVNISLKTSTKKPTLLSPISNSIQSNLLTLSYILPDKPLPGSAKIKFTNESNTYILTLNPQNITTTQSFNWDINTNPIGTAVSSISSNLVNGLPSGVYSVTIEYQDIVANPIQNDLKTQIRILKKPSLIFRVKSLNNKYVGKYFTYKDSLDNPIDIDGVKKINIFKDGKAVAVLSDSNGASSNNQIDSFLINVHRLKWNNKANTIIGIDSLTDGEYVLKSTYQSKSDINGLAPVLSQFTDTIIVQGNPFFGNITHSTPVVYGSYIDTLLFTYPVKSYNFDSLVFNNLNGSISAKIDSIRVVDNKKFAVFVTPLQYGKIKMSYNYSGAAIDSAGTPSMAILSDSGVLYAERIIPTITGNVSFCQGDSAILTSSVAKTYLWSNGATTQSIIVKQAGEYSVTTTYDNLVSGTSSNTTITKFPITLTPTVKDTSFCLNVKADGLNATSSSNHSLLWYGTNALGGTSTITASIPSTTSAGSSKYYVSQVNKANGCESSRAMITVNVYNIPAAPSLTRDASNLLVANVSGISWFKDGIALTDTAQKLKPVTAGTYTAKTTQNGCISSVSSPYYFVITDIVNLEENQFIKVTPNPYSSNIYLHFFLKGYNSLSVDVLDFATGRPIANRVKLLTGSNLNLQSLSTGIYIIKVYSLDMKFVHMFKIVKL